VTYISSPEGLAALDLAIATGLQQFTPPPVLSLSAWADEFAILSREDSAQPGKFQTSSAEYQRGAMDAITDAAVEKVVLMWASQTGKTRIQMNAIGYYSHHDPSPIMIIQFSLEEAEKFSKNRIAKMIRDTPALRKLFKDPRSRDSGNTLLNKEFPGGVLTIAGANSPAGLASKPIRILMPDEVDRYPESAGTEGDPVSLAEKRTTTFWNRKKIMASTPGIKGLSRIEKAFELTDKCFYYVPCPHCAEMQTLIWDRLKWSKSPKDKLLPESCFYVCVNGCEIKEGAKYDMVRLGQWRPTTESVDGKSRGFHLNALYSPWITWPEIITEWLEAQGPQNTETLKTFVNTRLAETWELRGQGAEQSELEKRKEAYTDDPDKDLVPAGALILTVGADVQGDRIEATLMAWGLNDESWAIDHKIFRGDPAKQEIWDELDSYLLQTWQHQSGVQMRVVAVMVDSGGHHTKQVYAFTRKREIRKVYSIKGVAGIGRPLVGRPNRVGKEKTLLFTVGVDTAKELLYSRLRNADPGPGYCHYPAKPCFDAEYFKQLTSEHMVTRTVENQTKIEWKKKYERNEALDCRVYAMAALELLQPKWDAVAKNFQIQVEAAKNPKDKTSQPQNTLNRSKSCYVNSWRRR
jgi:phage terminase large subunit GpA-like protein